ncbi:MAG: hypothetical protein BWY89_00441 [Bacteroidetes bacterium ADurb.BinA012]|nr:MAG: hypothetical protein BWY89_00441 [Bacteroidetes bacterium ADurb.BinA012]
MSRCHPPGAEYPQVREHSGIIDSDIQCLQTPHRETCQCTVAGGCFCTVILFDEGDDALGELSFEHCECHLSKAHRPACVPVRHYNQHRLGHVSCNQVIKNKVGLALDCPTSLIFASAVEDIENGISPVTVQIIACGLVNVELSPGIEYR